MIAEKGQKGKLGKKWKRDGVVEAFSHQVQGSVFGGGEGPCRVCWSLVSAAI